jgi:hypothetical protein
MMDYYRWPQGTQEWLFLLVPLVSCEAQRGVARVPYFGRWRDV